MKSKAFLTDASLEASLEMVDRPLPGSQAAFMAEEARCDQIHTVLDSDEEKCQEFEAKLPEWRSFLDDYSFLLSWSTEIFYFDANRALHKYLRPLFMALSDGAVDFCFPSTRHVDTPGKPQGQSTSLLISYLGRRLLPSDTVSNWGSTTSRLLGPGSLYSKKFVA